MTHFAEAKHMKGQYLHTIMAKPNVVGVGIGYKETAKERSEDICITVLVCKKLPIDALPPTALVPAEFKGVQTDVVEVGDINHGREFAVMFVDMTLPNI